MFKELLRDFRNESSMDALKLSTANQEGTWFGVLVDAQNRLVASSFSNKSNPSKRLRRIARYITQDRPKLGERRYADNMIQLFNGRDIVESVHLNPQLATVFQRRVYRILRTIPKSRVTTYGMIATRIKSGPRAVGTAVASNPWSIFVPCHRVVPSDLSVGNYSMNNHPDREGSSMKRELLKREGVLFHEDKILPESLWKPR